nr:protein lava lamp isoform X1 [Nothobranchius furzeri]
MSKKPSRWQETPMNTKTNKPLQDQEKVLIAGKQAKAGAHSAKSSRGGESSACKGVGGSRTSLGHQANARHAFNPTAAAPRLCSSRSFSSLQSASLTAAPFMRSSRSLSRLDQKSPDADKTASISPVKKGQTTGRKILDSVRLASSVQQISSAHPQASSSFSAASVGHHHNKGKKHTKDGVYTLCSITSGVKSNWVQAVLKNVRPALTQNLTSSISEKSEEQLEENRDGEQKEESHQPQPEGASSSTDVAFLCSSPAPSPVDALQQVEESEGMTELSLCAGSIQRDSPPSTVVINGHQDCEGHPNSEQSSQRCENTQEERQDFNNLTITTSKDVLPHELQTAQLVKELQQTQRELSRIQQLNRNLQDELQQEKEIHSGKLFTSQNGISSSPDKTLTSHHLQKINHNLRMELDALKKSQEEAQEAELLRRVDLLAQQAQLLVTGDATALAQVHLEQDLQRLREQKEEWEHSTASLTSQLSISEEKRKEAESCLLQLQEELQSQQGLQEEAEQLRKHLQEISAQLRAHEDTQAEKEARLQNHLTLLQASQERERRSLAAGLAQAEQRSQNLQDKLERAEQQLETFSKSQALTREIEEAQQQLQEELASTVSAVQQLQEEREQLRHRCQELQSQLSEADREVSRLQDRLKTEETHYYNLEHSYERACEDLQLALGKVQQREAETQDIREGYERLLDRKEQELSEVLLKMEVLGNSLEETEVKLNERMEGCTCSSPQKDGSSEHTELRHKQQQTPEYFTVNENSSQQPNIVKDVEVSSTDPRARSHSVDASYQYIISPGDDPDKFVSAIQVLETKLFVTEEKLRDLTHSLEEHQSHISGQDPHLYSQLTQSRATAQHLSLLLHSQAKQSQRFAQETESRCRMLVGRFQVALNIVQACRERLQATPVNIPDIERQLASVVSCLQHGEKDAERVQRDSRNAFKDEGKILRDEKLAGAEGDIISTFTDTQPSHDISSVGKHLIRELFVIEKMVSVLQTQNGICELSSAKRKDKEDVACIYKSLISQRISLKAEERTSSGRAQWDREEFLENKIGRFCAEAELIYAALKLQQSVTQNNQEADHQREGLAEISPSELAAYEETDKLEGRSSNEAAKPVRKEQSDEKKAEKDQGLLEKLISRLQRRATFLYNMCQELPEDEVDHGVDKASTDDLNFFQEQVKLIYLSDKLYLDLQQEVQQTEVLQNNLQALCRERKKQEMLSHTLNQLQEDNDVLKEELELAEKKILSAEARNQRLLEDIQNMEDFQKEQMKKVENEFQEKIKELQQIHEEEMQQLHGCYTKSGVSKEKACSETSPLKEDTHSLSDQATAGSHAKEVQTVDVDAAAIREEYLRDLEKLQASCDHGFAAMEEMHKKILKDIQEEHQKQVAELLKEKDQLLQEETAATMTAIVAIRRAHKKELERNKQTQQIRESADVTELQMEYEKEIQLLHKELEVLSSQHMEKCLENTQLSQELQDERRLVTQYQKENKQLKDKERERDELFQQPGNPQVSKIYQMEMILRAKDAEMQCLRDELETTRMVDKVYAENKVKDLQRTDNSEAFHHAGADSKFATWSPSRVPPGHGPNNPAAATDNPPFPKKSSFMRQIRGIRSKSLKEGLSIQEKLKLFESF